MLAATKLRSALVALFGFEQPAPLTFDHLSPAELAAHAFALADQANAAQVQDMAAHASSVATAVAATVAEMLGPVGHDQAC